MIFFSDMDGTFLTSTKQVSDMGWQALDALAAAGIEFVPCTGRPLSGIPAEVLAHPSVHYAVSANGAVAAKLDAKNPQNTDLATVIYSAPLSREKALAVHQIAREYDVTFDLFADGNCLLRRDLYNRLDEFMDDPFILQSMRNTRTPVDEEPEQAIQRVDVLERVAMYWKDPADRDAILARLRSVDGIEITRSYPQNIEVMEAGTSKGTAMTWLCGHLGIDPSKATCFGDNHNDISMLELAGCGAAVCNAEREVRDAADVILASNDEDGVPAYILSCVG